MEPEHHQAGHHSIMDVRPTTPEQVQTPAPAPEPQPVTPPTPATAVPSKSKRPLPILAIVIAIVAALLIIAIAVVLYLNSQHKSTTAGDSGQTDTTNQNSNGHLSGQDVTDVKQELNKNLNNLSDSKDFPADDLSDQTLGL